MQMNEIKANENLSIDERIDLINKATEGIKENFMVIACEMVQIKEQLQSELEPLKCNYKGNDGFLKLMEEKTGYKKSSVYHFINAKAAIDNLSSFSTAVENLILPDSERVIRPIATTKLNKDPEKQFEIWQKACGIAKERGHDMPTETDVKEVMKELQPPTDRRPSWKDEFIQGLEEEIAEIVGQRDEAEQKLYESKCEIQRLKRQLQQRISPTGITKDDKSMMMRGLKLLAKQLHTDVTHNGNDEPMKQLNAVMAKVKEI